MLVVMYICTMGGLDKTFSMVLSHFNTLCVFTVNSTSVYGGVRIEFFPELAATKNDVSIVNKNNS